MPDTTEKAIRADERARCVAELRAYSTEAMAAAVNEVVVGKDEGFVSVAHAAAVGRAATLLESGALSAREGGAFNRASP